MLPETSLLTPLGWDWEWVEKRVCATCEETMCSGQNMSLNASRQNLGLAACVGGRSACSRAGLEVMHAASLKGSAALALVKRPYV